MDTLYKTYDNWNSVKKQTIQNTSTLKDNDYFHKFEYQNKQNGIVKNSAMILQLRTFSIKRLMNKIGVINNVDFEIVVSKAKNIISPT